MKGTFTGFLQTAYKVDYLFFSLLSILGGVFFHTLFSHLSILFYIPFYLVVYSSVYPNLESPRQQIIQNKPLHPPPPLKRRKTQTHTHTKQQQIL